MFPQLRLEIDMGGDIDGPEDLVHQVAEQMGSVGSREALAKNGG